MKYVATFYTHFGAFTFHKRLQELGDDSAKLIAAPRKISVSCGTAVSFTHQFDPQIMADEDKEDAYIVKDDEFEMVYHNE